MTVQTAVALQNNWSVSDLVLHMEVAQIGIENIRFYCTLLYYFILTLFTSTLLYTSLNHTNLLKFVQINKKHCTLFTLLNPFYRTPLVQPYSIHLYPTLYISTSLYIF